MKQKQAKKCEDCPSDITSVFFLREITIPLLDELIEEMCARFNENMVAYADSFYFIPSVLRKSITQNGDSWNSKVKQFMNSKAGDMHDTSTLDAEIELWENKWMNVPTDTIEKEFSSVQDLLDIVEPSIYPNIYRALELLAVFPTDNMHL